MKNNTEETKQALLKAWSQVPQDNSLSEVRFHIRSALSKLESVEQKRGRRQADLEKRAEKREMGTGNVNAFDPFRAIQAIDEEIARERQKINEIRNRRFAKPKDEKDDGDELQTIFS